MMIWDNTLIFYYIFKEFYYLHILLDRTHDNLLDLNLNLFSYFYVCIRL